MDVPSPTDEELMQRVQLGDRLAYERLYERWREPIFAFLLRRCGALAEAEEAHQETWLRVYRSSRRYDPKRPFRPWLYTIAVNAGRDAQRPQPEIFELPDIAGPDARQLRDLLVSALQELDPADRRLLLLAIDGFTAVEVAEMLGIAPGAVRTRLFRARERVRAALGGTDA